MTDLAKVANSGVIRTADVVAVHPARQEDPRSTDEELDTASLRRSKSDYSTQHTFPSENYTGEGNDAQFKSIDL